MRSMLKWIVTGLVCCSPMIEAQDRPVRRPGTRGNTRPEVERMERQINERGDWEEAEAFFKAHSPNRWKEFQSIKDDGLRQRLRGMMLGRWRAMQWTMREGNEAFLEGRKKQLALEDEVFAIRMSVRRGDKRPAEIRDALKAKVRELVEERLRERQARLERMKRFIAEEEQDLEKDWGEINALVDGEIDRPGSLEQRMRRDFDGDGVPDRLRRKQP